MDEGLVGGWRVLGIDMPEGRTGAFVDGPPGGVVEFMAGGCYVVDAASAASGRPCGVYLCRTFRRGGLACLDLRPVGLPSRVIRCVYRVEGDRLSICVAGDYGPRPRALRRDDARLWCVMTLTRCQRPKKTASGLVRLARPPAA